MPKHPKEESLLKINNFLQGKEEVKVEEETFKKLMFIYSVAMKELVTKLPGIKVLKEKDYVTKPKESGYSSYHLILEVPVTLSQQQIYVKVEVQIRTLAMDFWANIEHKTKYKTEGKISKKESKQLISYAKAINKIDNNMMILSSK